MDSPSALGTDEHLPGVEVVVGVDTHVAVVVEDRPGAVLVLAQGENARPCRVGGRLEFVISALVGQVGVSALPFEGETAHLVAVVAASAA